jgi:YopX protein
MKKRGIKFRAWNQTKKKMVDSYLHFDKQGKVVGVLTYPDDEYLPLQYTGLKDTNGKEIYEGDIVHWFDELGKNPLPFVVAYKRTHFVLTIPNEKLKGWDLDRQKLEVIGNIYENPELLKRVKRD